MSCQSVFPAPSVDPRALPWVVGQALPGEPAGIPRAAASPALQEEHSRTLAKPLCFFFVRLRALFFFFFSSAQILTVLEKGTWSGLFVFKSVLTA